MKTVLIRKLIFVVLVALLFALFVRKGLPLMASKGPFKNDNRTLLLTGAIFSAVVWGLLWLANLCGHESYKAFPPLSPSMCRGGSYMWSGDGEFSKMCRAAEKTPEGRCAIAAANCAGPGSMRGQPRNFPRYSPNSDSNWKAIPCCKGDKPCLLHEKHHDCGCMSSDIIN